VGEQPAEPMSRTPAAGGQVATAGARPRRRFERLRAIAWNVGRLSPYAVVFSVYGAVLDYLPDSWFAAGWLRYVFGAMIGLLTGLAVLAVFQQPAVRRALQPPPRPAGEVVPPPPPQAQAPAPAAAVVPSVRDILGGAQAKLMAELREGMRGEDLVRGWPQFLDDPDKPPGAVGSAYGLRLVQALDIRDGRLDPAQVIRSVLLMQRPGGGWSSRAQRVAGARPEQTAFVLPALVRAGLDTQTRARLVGVLEGLLDPVTDPALALTTVVATSLVALAEVAPGSPYIPRLAAALDRGALIVQDGERQTVAWGHRVQGPATPSTPHTARAVLALLLAARIAPERGGRYARQAAAGAGWLRAHANLAYQDEQVRRPQGEDTDMVVVGHFTAAWVARALLACGDGADSAALLRAVAEVRDAQDGGVWRPPNTALEPVWMTYQGVAVLREYALRNLPWPPDRQP
jgi:hypothetical protein